MEELLYQKGSIIAGSHCPCQLSHIFLFQSNFRLNRRDQRENQSVDSDLPP